MDLTDVTARIDDTVADRYRIDELVGVGPLSAVFAALDLEQDRWVALKLFGSRLAEDERFTSRLLDAVEQSAALSQPNIVQIHDWGADDGLYIVSELCEGGSLASMIREGGRLSASQALIVALHCARALDHGHGQGVIHRNLKPANVLFGSDQQVRVSDYGLAKVLNEAPVSQAAGALEHVRYHSPEQARGRPVSESTDLYSLALVVNEAVSGEQPPIAETVVGTLMARAEAPAKLSEALGNLLLPFERCGRVDPEDRPEAEEFAIALLAAAESMSRPDPFPLAGVTVTGFQPASGVVPDADDDLLAYLSATDPDLDTEVGHEQVDLDPGDAEADPEAGLGGAREARSDRDRDGGLARDHHDGDVAEDFDVSALGPLDELDGFASGAGEPDEGSYPDLRVVESAPPTGGSLENLAEAEPVFADTPTAENADRLDVPSRSSAGSATGAYEELQDDVDDHLPWWPLAVFLSLGAIAAVAGVYLVLLAGSTSSARLPDLAGVDYDTAAAQLGANGWDVKRLEARQNGTTPGTVIGQNPVAGSSLDEGGAVSLTVSLGDAMVEIPSDIVGLTIEQAESRLAGVGLGSGALSQEHSEAFAAGLVIGLDEPTTQKPSGQGVDLRVSLGPEPRLVPDDLVGQTIGDATSLLAGLRLQAVEELAYSPDVEPGVVLGSIPRGGETVPADSAITVLVSAGPEPVEVPDVVGLSLNDAIDAIEEVGLIFIDTEGTPGEDAIATVPEIGERVDVGTEIVIILDDPDDDEEDTEQADGDG